MPPGVPESLLRRVIEPRSSAWYQRREVPVAVIEIADQRLVGAGAVDVAPGAAVAQALIGHLLAVIAELDVERGVGGVDDGEPHQRS
jgi:hypothetical protein